MVASKHNFAPFGSKLERFGKITTHPNLDPSGLYVRRPNGCDPCLYQPQSINKIYEINKNKKDVWTYKKELEEWSKHLGYRNQRIIDYNKWRKSVLGPAWHDIGVLPKCNTGICKNQGFGRTPRYKPCKISLPGPGTYYKAVLFKSPYGPHSERPTFKREDPCRFKNISTTWSLAPNRYKIIDKNAIDQKSKKVVSLRGPYDLFTGKRDASTIKNHFNKSGRCTAASWPIALKGCLEDLKMSNFGKMNKTNRSHPYRGRNALIDLTLCVRRPSDPGPAHYNIDNPRILKKNAYGFNSTYDKPPGYQKTIVWPGVGRYNPKAVSYGITGQGHRYVFLSKQVRTIGADIPKPMNSF